MLPNNTAHIAHISALAQNFIKCSEGVPNKLADEALPPAASHESAYYQILRSILIAQARGNYDAGEKLAELFRDVEGPLTPEAFNECMERLLRRMGGAA